MDTSRNDPEVTKRWLNILRGTLISKKELLRKLPLPTLADFLNCDIDPMEKIKAGFIQGLPARKTHRAVANLAPGLAYNTRCFDLFSVSERYESNLSFKRKSLMIVVSGDANVEFGIAGTFVIWDAEYDIQDYKESKTRKLHFAISSEFRWLEIKETLLELLSQKEWDSCQMMTSLERLFSDLQHDLLRQALDCNTASAQIGEIVKGLRHETSVLIP